MVDKLVNCKFLISSYIWKWVRLWIAMMKSNTYFFCDYKYLLFSLASEFIIACNVDCSVTSLTRRVPKHSHLQFSNLSSELLILMVAVNCTIIQLTHIYSAVSSMVTVLCRYSSQWWICEPPFWHKRFDVSCFLFGDIKHDNNFLLWDLKLSQQCWWRFKTVGCYIM